MSESVDPRRSSCSLLGFVHLNRNSQHYRMSLTAVICLSLPLPYFTIDFIHNQHVLEVTHWVTTNIENVKHSVKFWSIGILTFG